MYGRVLAFALLHFGTVAVVAVFGNTHWRPTLKDFIVGPAGREGAHIHKIQMATDRHGFGAAPYYEQIAGSTTVCGRCSALQQIDVSGLLGPLTCCHIWKFDQI